MDLSNNSRRVIVQGTKIYYQDYNRITVGMIYDCRQVRFQRRWWTSLANMAIYSGVAQSIRLSNVPKGCEFRLVTTTAHEVIQNNFAARS